jgi:secreted PhoX family phosphatase
MPFGIDEDVSNESPNPPFEDVLARRLSRRGILTGGLVTAGLGLAGPLARPRRAGAQTPALLGFRGIPPSRADAVVVAPGYTAEVLYAWGDPISNGPTFRPDASNSWEEQAVQAGMHHDGIHYFPLPAGRASSNHGLLAMNHEYTDDGLLHPGGMQPWTAEKVRKAQASHGVSVIEVRASGSRWEVVRPSSYARRVTGYTPMGVSGPAAGHELLRTALDPTGRTILGTLNNCAHGFTPWGTYLTCEENFNGYFVNRSGSVSPLERRYGINERAFGYRWHEHDERFDAVRHPNEPNRFGWVVEIDPYEPFRAPVKHTALGRFKHEGAWLTLARDGRAVVYMGDDERFEYVFKFVSRDPYRPGSRDANRAILEHGTLYVARFDADGSGEWIGLVHGRNGLDAGAGFRNQADVVVNARGAGDAVKATRMDRPEWIAVHPRTGEAYCALTNNSRRGAEKMPAPDAANPRPTNDFGHIVRWREQGGDPAATRFGWDVFILAGDPAHAEPGKHGNIRGDLFGSPDGLWFDDRGVLWIQTDVSTSVINKGEYAVMGNNQMLACDPSTREVRRFLVGPATCEVTGVIITPDGRTMFVNIQHPGEGASERANPAEPKALSAWPDGPAGGRPRSATIVIKKADGGVIGT